MITWLRQLDRLLRGDATQLSSLKAGRIEFPTKEVLSAAVVLAMTYGACMGLFAVLRTGGAPAGWMQMLASVVKLPLLFLLTLIVTLPSLYVFNALVGSRLTLISVVNLLVASMAVTVAVLASLGTIIVFFSLSSSSHPFMLLLNVLAATVAGLFGTRFMFHTLNRLVFTRERGEIAPPPLPTESEPEFALEPRPRKLAALEAGELGEVSDARSVFRTWAVVFALVGAQMSWVLRPFVGSPSLKFEWFREKQDNFFIAIVDIIRAVLSGG